MPFVWLYHCTIPMSLKDDIITATLHGACTISSPGAAILLVYARNRDLWARLKARQKGGQISLAVETCSFQPRSSTHAQNQTGTKNCWFRFLNRPERLRLTATGQTQTLGTRLGPARMISCAHAFEAGFGRAGPSRSVCIIEFYNVFRPNFQFNFDGMN